MRLYPSCSPCGLCVCMECGMALENQSCSSSSMCLFDSWSLFFVTQTDTARGQDRGGKTPIRNADQTPNSKIKHSLSNRHQPSSKPLLPQNKTHSHNSSISIGVGALANPSACSLTTVLNSSSPSQTQIPTLSTHCFPYKAAFSRKSACLR